MRAVVCADTAEPRASIDKSEIAELRIDEPPASGRCRGDRGPADRAAHRSRPASDGLASARVVSADSAVADIAFQPQRVRPDRHVDLGRTCHHVFHPTRDQFQAAPRARCKGRHRAAIACARGGVGRNLQEFDPMSIRCALHKSKSRLPGSVVTTSSSMRLRAPAQSRRPSASPVFRRHRSRQAFFILDSHRTALGGFVSGLRGKFERAR